MRVASLVPILFIFTVIQVPATLFLLFWFVSQLFSGWLAIGGAAGSNIAWWAHVGGFLFGILSVFLFARRRIYHYWAKEGGDGASIPGDRRSRFHRLQLR
jgi:membrane associated rhomboid family serine protease